LRDNFLENIYHLIVLLHNKTKFCLKFITRIFFVKYEHITHHMFHRSGNSQVYTMHLHNEIGRCDMVENLKKCIKKIIFIHMFIRMDYN
jgi:hypothetical protein